MKFYIVYKNVHSLDTEVFLLFQVKENDGLPQVVCIRCLGTLEFLCDFYERCHLTQKEFLKTVRYVYMYIL